MKLQIPLNQVLYRNSDYQKKADDRKACKTPFQALQSEEVLTTGKLNVGLLDVDLIKFMYITESTRLNPHRGGIFTLTELLIAPKIFNC